MRSSILKVLVFAICLAFSLSGCKTTSKKSYLSLGNQYAKDGLLREAADSYKRVIAKRPKHQAAHRNLGMVYVKLGNYQLAVKHLEKSMRRYDKDFDANFYLGEAYRAQDRYAEAIFRYQRALKLREGDARALKPLAWSFFKIRYYSEALLAARKLKKAAPSDDQVGIIISRTLLKMKRSREALLTMQTARKRIKKKSIPYYFSVEGDILYELGSIKAATKAYRSALKDQPLLAGALLGLGRCMLDGGKTKNAITYMERAVRIRPRLTEAHYLLGKAYEGIDRQKSLRYYRYFRRQASADPEFLGMVNDVKKRIGALQKRRNRH